MNSRAMTKKDLIEEISLLKQKIRDMEQAEVLGKKDSDALRFSNLILSTQLEMSLDGILVVDRKGKMILWNRRFVDMWGIPSRVMESSSDDLAIKSVLDKLVDPDQFEDATRRLYEDTEATGHNELALLDGRTFDRYSAPIVGGDGMYSGRVWYFRDITKRKKAEDALRESEEVYHAIFEAMPVMTWLKDTKNNHIRINRAAADLEGITPESVIGKSAYDLYPRDQAEAYYQDDLQVINSGMPKLGILEPHTAVGTSEMRWLEVGKVPVRDHRNVIIGVMAIAVDVTERINAEKALRESEAFSRSLIRYMQEAVIILSWSGEILFANEAAAEMMEMPSPEGLIKRNMLDFLHAGSRQKAVDDLAALKNGKDEGQIDEYRLTTTKGRALWMETLGGRIPFQGEDAAMICMRDVTERKRAEKALRESEERFSKTFNSSPAVMTISEIETGRYIDVNETTLDMLGYTREEMVGRTSYELGIWVDPEAREQAEKILRERGSFRELPVRFRSRSGKILDALWSGEVISFGARKALLSLIFDISERKRLEAQLIQAQKLEAIGTLSSGLTHNFNNILNGIQGYTTMLRLRMEPDNPYIEWLDSIQEQVQSGADLTRQLLGFARGEKYDTTQLDISKVLARSAGLFGKAKKEIVMHMSLAGDPLIVQADQNQMEQVFLNLFTNAAHAMPTGGNIYLETQFVSLTLNDVHPYEAVPGTYVRITVKDTGTGMDAKTQERIFEPFFTTKPEGQGTGLGLSSVYGIIKGHKGFINVDSRVEHGTTFTIFLPATRQEIVPEKEKAPEILTGKETILVIDDEAVCREIGREFLKFLGYRVYTVGSGQEAIAVYMQKHGEINMIILDMIMPGISGGETFDRLKEINPDAKVLLSSGYSINSEVQQILDRGCKGFIKKTFSTGIAVAEDPRDTGRRR